MRIFRWWERDHFLTACGPQIRKRLYFRRRLTRHLHLGTDGGKGWSFSNLVLLLLYFLSDSYKCIFALFSDSRLAICFSSSSFLIFAHRLVLMTAPEGLGARDYEGGRGRQFVLRRRDGWKATCMRTGRCRRRGGKNAVEFVIWKKFEMFHSWLRRACLHGSRGTRVERRDQGRIGRAGSTELRVFGRRGCSCFRKGPMRVSTQDWRRLMWLGPYYSD